ncbi:MAG: helix-turn-helix domain-containing protein [Ruthenibacterium sp.]
MFNQYPDVLTVKQMTQALGIGKNTAYQLVKDKKIASKRVGRKILIPKPYLIDFVESSRYNISL